MAPQIFITGVTGYVGGELLHSIISKHPDYTITGLVRTPDQAQAITSKHPSLNVVLGDLDSSEIIIEQSKQADVVLQSADCDHQGAIKSIIKGLSQSSKNGVFIQLSGAASISDHSTGIGQPSPKIWDDVADFDEITTFDHKTHFHAASDQLVLSEGKRTGVRTVIVAPPKVFGKARGLKEWSMGLPGLVEGIKKRERGFTLGPGKQLVSCIHVQDIADVLLFFAEQGLQADGGVVEWGDRGYYYAEAEENAHVDVVKAIVKGLVEKGVIETAEIDEITAEEGTAMDPFAVVMWGANMRIRATRLRGLGWTPKQPGDIEAVAELLD